MALTPSFVTKAELEAVYFSLMADKDTEALEILLQLAPPLGIQFSEESKDAVLALHADTGNTVAVESYMSKFCPEPTETQRHLHVKAYLLSLPADTFPTPALELVHAYEGKNAPAPMKTYTKLLSHLYALRSNSGIARAKTWDLFAHMRYVAHPDPDVVLYTTMIRACASPVAKGWRSSDPERALDLWTEMTVEKQMVPTSGSYDAIILACARSGQRVFVDHAFQLLQQMLDGHRDAFGRSAFAPTKRTWIALLEGLKRLGDLKRARWVFVEVVRRGLEAEKQLGQQEENREKSENDLDEGVMIHLFQAYASHKPNPNIPGRKKILDVPQSSSSGPSAPDPSDPSTQSAPATTTPATPPAPFASLFSGFPQSSMPTSSQEIITEVNFLFERILASRFSPTHMQSRLDKIFKHTSLTPTLLNAFLQVHYAHSPNILSIRGFFERAFTAREGVDGYLSMQPNVYSFVDALERCASQVQKHSRGMTGQEVDKMVDASAKWSEKLWEGFLALKIGEADDGGKLETKEARLVERAWAAYIRVLTMSGRITKALNTVKLFTSKYPPSLAEATASTALSLSPTTTTTTSSLPSTPAPARPLALSSRTTLFSDNRTLINTNPQHQHTPDSYVPPILTFGDLKGLHHAIVTSTQYSEFGRRGEERRKKDVGYLTWVCHAYARGVRKRMRGVESAKVVKGSSGEVEVEPEEGVAGVDGEVDVAEGEGAEVLLREDGTGRRKAWEVLYQEKNI
ncbi:hypothetical protein DL96DRAFT_1524985 [Flagelloscypha sp. PMI_526]|nr:hypothetical protein DL96DRAFT_1524985 [Flagelloscypha sp. PMI_526]